MTVTAWVKSKETEGDEKLRYIEVIPYGMFVYREDGTPDPALTLRFVELCAVALEKGTVSLEELAEFGEERPEGYIYAYGLLHHFAFAPDAPQVCYPNHELFTLYPADDTYRRIDTLC